MRLEVIDIWHFGMSALFEPGGNLESVADRILADLEGHSPSGADVRAATEALAAARTDYNDRQQLLSAGESTTRDLLASEAALRNAELQLVNAYLDVRVALARIDKAMGRLAPAPAQEKK